jgi:hypothetical protein
VLPFKRILFLSLGKQQTYNLNLHVSRPQDLPLLRYFSSPPQFQPPAADLDFPDHQEINDDPKTELEDRMMLYRQQTAENRSTSGLGKLLEDVLANEEVIGRAECKTIIRNKILLQKLWIFLIFVAFQESYGIYRFAQRCFLLLFISSLVVAMISAKRVEDAILFAERLCGCFYAGKTFTETGPKVWAEEAGNYTIIYIFNFLKMAIYFSH